ncbi:MAG: amidohydrolase family protein, partial [Bacteroidales bacterium]
MKYIITNANIINEGRIFRGSVIIENSLIKEVIENPAAKINSSNAHVIDAGGKYLLPGIIDDHVHFREPGLTHKADIYTESKAAVAGGVTSFMDMPNTIPNAITRDLLEEKFQLASKKSLVNYSFYIGATNDNIDELKKIDNSTVCGIKVFMGSSTGNMLVDDMNALQQIFSLSSSLIAVHCEDEKIIRENIEKYKAIYGENIPVFLHPAIRSSEACFKSSSLAVELAVKHNTRLHLLHLSSADEINLPDNSLSPEKKKITAEV